MKISIVSEAVLKLYKKSVKHNLDAGQLNHSLSGLRQELIVDGQSAKVLQPGESSFDNPSSGDDLEFAGAFVRAKHDFDDPAELPERPVTKGALVSAVGKYLSQARELVLGSRLSSRSRDYSASFPSSPAFSRASFTRSCVAFRLSYTMGLSSAGCAFVRACRRALVSSSVSPCLPKSLTVRVSFTEVNPFTMPFSRVL